MRLKRSQNKLSARLPAGALAVVCLLANGLFAQSNEEPEAYAISGRPLFRIAFPDSQQLVLEANLTKAQAEYEQNPIEVDRIIWYGRRLAYLWRYRDAVAIYTQGIKLHPSNAKLYRHRGHRYITLRQFDKAIQDLERAALLIKDVPDEVEPDGAPNRYNIPTSTTNSNIWYHLGVAYYLNGDFKNAARAFAECLAFAKNDDMLCATTDWLYMVYRRLGRRDEAERVLTPVRKDMNILENYAYHRRLLLYKRELAPEELLGDAADDLTVATQGYGVGNWYLVNGEMKRAKEIFEKVVAGPYWAAFGYIAAEVELARMAKEDKR